MRMLGQIREKLEPGAIELIGEFRGGQLQADFRSTVCGQAEPHHRTEDEARAMRDRPPDQQHV